MPNINHYGHIGHFICGWNCHFHLLTTIMPDDGGRGVYISTIGDYYRRTSAKQEDDVLEKINLDTHYETMIFPYAGAVCHCTEGCDGPQPIEFMQIKERRIDTRKKANDMHARLVRIYTWLIARGWRPKLYDEA